MTDTTWDVDKYKTAYESDEHWELRRKFMMAHKETLPEDELVCMAQVFTNIEFLGCRYPNETMIRVAELAKGVVEEFREKKKNTLKRTFVTASDAASSKVKGLGGVNIISAKKPKLDDNFNTSTSDEIKSGPGILGKFVLFLTPNNSSRQILDRSVQLNRVTKDTKFEVNSLTTGKMQATYFLLGEKFAEAIGDDKKTAINFAADIALEKLKKQCYSVVIKENAFKKPVEISDIGTNNTKQEEKMNDNNVGVKLMKLMGWTGGGLGSSSQGIEEPVAAVRNVYRSGFGSGDFDSFRTSVFDYLVKWLEEGAQTDLSFSTDFDQEHRKIIHEIGQRLGVKTQSYGDKNNRRLIASKKISPWNLVLELASGRDRSDKYELLSPG